MIVDGLKLTVYFGESDRVGGEQLSDVLIDAFERHGVETAVLMRGIEGFGVKHRLHTQRFLTLSEDLPLVALAVDTRERIEGLLPFVTEAVSGGGLVTLERTRLVHGLPSKVELPEELLVDSTKLTVYLGRDDRVRGRRAYLEVVDHLQRSGLAGATVLLGVDGMAHGRRERARFAARNADVPLFVLSVGSGEAIADALAGLDDLVAEPTATLERIRVCKRDGELLTQPRDLPQQDESGLGLWQKLTIVSGEQARHRGHPLYVELIRRLREEGASGATSVRGIWGYSGAHAPHGDRLTALRRRVPVVTTVIDTPEQIRRWFGIVDELTDEAALVTSELVPALLAVAPERRFGGLRLGRSPEL